MTVLEGDFWQLPSEKVGLLCEENNILFFENRSSLQKNLFSDKHFHFGDSGFATSSNKTLEFKGNSRLFKSLFQILFICVCVCEGLYTLNCIYMHNNLFSYCSEKEAFKNGRVKT